MLFKIFGEEISWISLFGVIAIIIIGISAALKSKKKILISYTIAHTLLSVMEILSSMWGAFIQDLFGAIKNITILAKKNTKMLNVLFLILSFALGIIVNLIQDVTFGNWYHYLGVIANGQFCFFIIYFGDRALLLKMSQFFACVLWGLNFLFVPGLMLTATLNFVSALVALVTLIVLFFKNKKVDE